MKNIYSQWFEIYRLKVEAFLNGKSEQSLSNLFEDIKGAAFNNKISDAEMEYLINLLPLEGIDDDGPEEKPCVNRKTGGILFDPNEKIGIRKRIKDEYDDFEEEEEEEESGFGGLVISQEDESYDNCDDYDYDDFEEEEKCEEDSSGFTGFYSNNKQIDPDDYDYDDFDDEEDTNQESGFFGLIK
jgi:hypothetical protein